MDTSHAEKLKILREIKRRMNGNNVLISTTTEQDRKFCVDDIKMNGLYPNIIETQEGGHINRIAVSSITEIKEVDTLHVLYPKPDVK